MKNIGLLELEGKLQNPIMEFMLEHEDYLEKEQIDTILSKGESGLEDLRLILKSYNQHHLKFKDDDGVWFMSSVLLALAYLRDEDSFDGLMAYLYTNYDAINTTWGDGYFEALPMCYAVFPNKILQIKEALYDPELTIDMKRILTIGLYSMPNELNRSDLEANIAPIFLDYLEFLLIPENRQTQEKAHEEWVDLSDLFSGTVEGYMNCGGDGNHPALQQAFQEELDIEYSFDKNKLTKWRKDGFKLWDIYTHNSGIEKFQKANEEYRKKRDELEAKEAQLKNVLNVTKKYRKIFDRNDKVTVRYKDDDKVISNIKYKKIEDDLIAGKCEII